MAANVRFRCQNPDCRLETEIPAVSLSATQPLCTCGSVMKKVYAKPQLRVLSRIEAEKILSEGLTPAYTTAPPATDW